jgi:hypothetical protein
MAGCYGNHPFDQYLEKELDDYLNSSDDGEDDGDCNSIVCQNCGNETEIQYYNSINEENEHYLECFKCGHQFTH